MFGIGSTEFLVIILVALLVLGPRNLARASRTVGRYVGEFRRISTDFQRTLNAEVAEEERQENRDAIRKKVEAAKAARERRESRKKRKTPPVEADREARTATVESSMEHTGESPAVNPSAHAEAGTQTREDDGQAAGSTLVHEAGPEDMVRPPKGSPLEAALERTAREAAELERTDDAAADGQGGRA